MIKNFITGTSSMGAQRDSFLWNALAGGVNAAESVLILMICMRTNGIEDAGILTIAFAVANLMMTLGKYGIRTYQVTDVNNLFGFSDYLVSRIFTVSAMIVLSISYELFFFFTGEHSKQKAIVIILICLIYAVEALEDVFAGYLQKAGRLDAGAKIFIIRWIGIFVLFGIGFIMKANLVTIGIIAVIYSVIIEAYLVLIAASIVNFEKVQIRFRNAGKLLLKCLSLFMIAFLGLYLSNAPKYAIDRYMTEEIQACYGFIAMPIFVISLLNSLIYQPFLVEMSDLWKEGKKHEFQKKVTGQLKVVFGFTGIVLVGAFFAGIPVLSFLYHVSLDSYKATFLILMLGGGILAIAGYECVILTIMRQQSRLVWGYGILAVTATVAFEICANKYGIFEMAVVYDGLMLMLVMVFGFLIKRNMRKEKVVKDLILKTKIHF